MRVQPDDLIAGLPAKLIRKLLRHNRQFLSVADVTNVLGLGDEDAARLLKNLETQKFIKKNASAPGVEKTWQHTIKGGALSNALFSAPVTRLKAESALSGLMDRVKEVNGDRRLLFRVRRVVVFGSFLSESATVGDLDISIDLIPKESNRSKHRELILAHANAAELNGRQFQNIIERLDFAAQEVRSYLKGRSRIIQLTDCNDGVLEIAENRVLYEDPEKTPTVPKAIGPKVRLRRIKGCPF